MTKRNEDTTSVKFSVELDTLASDAADVCTQIIEGEIQSLQANVERPRAIGSLKSYLFDLSGLLSRGDDVFFAYDDIEAHLGDIARLLFKRDGTVRTPIKRAAGLQEFDWIDSHCHAFMMKIEHQFRGLGHGNRALRLLRRFVHRPGLIATARAFPSSPGQKPTTAEFEKLARYYLSDIQLGFRPIGPTSRGWLVAHWEEPV